MKKKVALVTGGYSGESVISYKSADTISKNLDANRWESYLIDIHPAGWFYMNGNKKINVDKNDFSITINDTKVTFDIALVALHGTPGEDGKLQGYLDCLNIPYTSCDAATSALTFNKRYTVAVAAFAGIRVAKSIHLFKKNSYKVEDIAGHLQLPVFVKPNNGGSSIGMSKVMKAEDLSAALEKAFAEDEQVLIEEFISGREFTIGIFRHQGKIITLPITEIISKNDFFDYQAKYEGASEEVTPALIVDTIAEKIRLKAIEAYEVFNCRGVVRIDFIFNTESDQPYLLEINTIPGQSAASIVPQQVAAMGWDLAQFYSAILDECFNC